MFVLYCFNRFTEYILIYTEKIVELVNITYNF